MESKNWQNLETPWYKHFIIYFKHSIELKFDLFSLKEWKITQNSQKMAPRDQNHKIDNKSSKMAIWNLKIGKTLKYTGANIL